MVIFLGNGSIIQISNVMKNKVEKELQNIFFQDDDSYIYVKTPDKNKRQTKYF